ncbi:MAG: hypothetical protein WCT49_02910 [Candidatus Paceibacterota bacterium]
MNFVVSLVHFIGWVILAITLFYIIFSLVFTVYAYLFIRRTDDFKNCLDDVWSWRRFACYVGFVNLWIYAGLVYELIRRKLRIRYFLKIGYSISQIEQRFDYRCVEVLKSDIFEVYPISVILGYVIRDKFYG